MLDLHNHVLFGLDDGCRTLEESRALCVLARESGHLGFVATPHIRAGLFNNTPDMIRNRWEQTRAVVSEAGLEFYLGAEYYFDETLLEAARAKALLTLGTTSRFVLTEFPQPQLPPRTLDILYEIRLSGYVPVIAHPERCEGVARNIEAARALFEQAGVLLQLDLGSLVGHYGPSPRRAAKQLLKHGAYHVAACDLHRPSDVKAIVSPSLKKLGSLLKKRGALGGLRALTVDNPRKIVENAALESIEAV